MIAILHCNRCFRFWLAIYWHIQTVVIVWIWFSLNHFNWKLFYKIWSQITPDTDWHMFSIRDTISFISFHEFINNLSSASFNFHLSGINWARIFLKLAKIRTCLLLTKSELLLHIHILTKCIKQFSLKSRFILTYETSKPINLDEGHHIESIPVTYNQDNHKDHYYLRLNLLTWLLIP